MTTNYTPNLECRMYEAKYPEPNTPVMIQVNKIINISAYVSLLEYNNMEGMILLNESSRRGIHSGSGSLLRVGHCQPVMVIGVDKEKGRIHLCDRRVKPEDIHVCNDKYYKSKFVHSIMRHAAKTMQIGLEDMYIHIGWPLYRKYGHAYEAFKLIANGSDSVLSTLTRKVKKIGPDGKDEVIKLVLVMSEELQDDLIMNIKRRMAPQSLEIRGLAEMECYGFNAIHYIKAAMVKAEHAGTDDCPVKIKVVSPGHYVISTRTLNVKQGILVLNRAIVACSEEIERHKGKFVVKEAPRAVSSTVVL